MLLETHNFEFGEFLLDAREKVLLRDGKPIPITPKAFQLLFLLVEKHGHLVEKNELMKSVWADSFVEEGNITFTIGLLRKLLEDNTKNPRFIETVPRRGYRFIADVRRVENLEEEDETSKTGEAEKEIRLSPNSSSPFLSVSPSHKGAVVVLADWRREASGNEAREQVSPSTAPEESAEQTFRPESVPTKPDSKSKYFSKYRFPLFVSAAFLIGAIAFGFYFYSNIKTSSADGKKSIAILPLKPINAGVRDEIYEIGIADSLIIKLGSMKGFVVRPLSAIRKYADIEQDAITAGREQQVDYVLASSYQLAGGKIRITAQLFNVATGQIEETYKSEKDAGDIFAVQDTIAGEIGNILHTRFAIVSSSASANRGTTDEEAYRLYLQGMYLYDRRTLADLRKAVGLLEQAIQLDLNYARAWAGKAHAHRSLGNFGGNTHEEYKKSIEAINRALALDENLTDAHSALCENKFFYEYDFDGAERECERAVELDANSARARDIYARYLLTRGRFEEAIAESKTAIDLEPTALFSQRNYGISLYYARRYTEAVAQFKRVSEIDPNFVATYAWLVPALNVQGSEAEAFEWFMKWQSVLKTDEETVHAYKTAYQTSGWKGVGHERVKRFDEGKIRSYFLEACLTVHTGDKEKAFEYLEKSYQRREWGIPYLQIDPSLDVLRDDPRFDELVRRIGLR